MGLQVCVLASGSSGNSIYIGNDNTRILIDVGISCSGVLTRLAEIGVEPASLHAVCITHEHDDHYRGLRVLHRRFGTPLFGNAGTVEAIQRNVNHRELPWNLFTTGHTFTIGTLEIHPFRVPHDSYDPVAFVVSEADTRIGVCTDLGIATDLVRSRLRDCDALVLETNHDEEMLLASNRPWSLKQRIRSHKGHLSNEMAGALLSELASERLRNVFLAHVSRDCNRLPLAMHTVRRHLARVGRSDILLHPTYPDRVSALIECSGAVPAFVPAEMDDAAVCPQMMLAGM